MTELYLVYLVLLSPVVSQSIPRPSWTTDPHLHALKGILEGPLFGWNIVLYLDPALEPSVSEYVQNLSVLRETPHVVADLGSDGAIWSAGQTKELLRGSFMLHVVVFQEDLRPFFREVSLQWNPQYVLLFSTANETRTDLLLDEVFQRVERLLLVERRYFSGSGGPPHSKVFSAFPFAQMKIRALGTWNPAVFASRDDLFLDRFESFEGYEFQLGTWFDDFPYLHQSKTKPEGYGDGVEVEMLDAMAKVFDFRYNLTTEPPDQKWGAFENGSWTGMLGMVYRKDKNFTVNYFVITGERVEAFDATVSYWLEGFGMSMLAPPPLSKWRGVYYPFQPVVWAGLGVTFAIALTVMTIQDRLQPKPFLGGLGSTWPYLFRAMFSSSIPSLPRANWQRIFVGVWWLYCFIVTAAYTANLIAFLTIPVFPERIQTVQQLADSNYRVSMFDYGEFVPGALKSSKDPYYRTLGEKLDLYPTYDGSVYAMLGGTHAYIESYSYNRILIFVDYEADDSYMLREQLYPGHLCWYFQKNTAWKYKFDQGIQRLVESGLIAHWIKVKTEDFLGRDFERKQQLKDKERINKPLGIDHLQGVFFVLLLSWVAGTLVFAAEILRHKWSPSGV